MTEHLQRYNPATPITPLELVRWADDVALLFLGMPVAYVERKLRDIPNPILRALIKDKLRRIKGGSLDGKGSSTFDSPGGN